MSSKILKTIQLLVCICIFGSFAFADGMPEGSEGVSHKGAIHKTVKPTAAVVKNEPKRPSLDDKDLLPYQYCGKDSDCMQVINGCCQCMQGDSFVAINKDRLEAFQARFKCEDVLCPKSENYSYSCVDGVVTCLNHRCLYVAPGKE